MHGGDAAVGTIESPEILIDGRRITLRIGGGKEERRLRAELRVGDQVIAQATGFQSERMELVSWDVAAYRGQRARLRLVDESSGSWGHLTVDEVWIWE
jgi:levanase